MDSNNFPGNCGIGEREARFACGKFEFFMTEKKKRRLLKAFLILQLWLQEDIIGLVMGSVDQVT